MDDTMFRARFRHTPLVRAKRRGLLRNAAVALGNLGDRSAVPALVGALSDEEPLVRGHAAWALRQLAPLPPAVLQTMETVLLSETDENVRNELAAALVTHGAASAAEGGG